MTPSSKCKIVFGGLEPERHFLLLYVSDFSLTGIGNRVPKNIVRIVCEQLEELCKTSFVRSSDENASLVCRTDKVLTNDTWCMYEQGN